MRVLSYLILAILSYLPALSLADVPDHNFNNELCPWYYIFQNYHNDPMDFTIELVATCGNSMDQTAEYITTSLNLDKCFTNINGNLTLATYDKSPLGPFSKSCRNCGLKNVGSFDDTRPTIYCTCTNIDDKISQEQAYELPKGIWVNQNGTIGCVDHFGTNIPYVDSKVPKMIPPNLLALMASSNKSLATVTATVHETVSSTVDSNNTLVSTATAMVTSNVTLVTTETATATVTATATMVSVVSATCPTAPAATVTETTTTTKTKKRKAKTVATVTTSLVSTVVVTVTTTRPPTGTIVAGVHTTAFASFTTVF
ncbi:uncharacterized protein F4812DRAFT_462369 [Daldinia caldariorum]|uniref:uncharacterized protein n=1 Tax=Daldinia caldariorum TaxID=326644 RepID=UPI002007B6D3|nr:uncharacterized protein F4812DRAFT_462369 [Daldinia caldariorum]KAI1464657.1 hypothetical protein F4812DRAFT_462369 [Daldinia caldariorum]